MRKVEKSQTSAKVGLQSSTKMVQKLSGQRFVLEGPHFCLVTVGKNVSQNPVCFWRRKQKRAKQWAKVGPQSKIIGAFLGGKFRPKCLSKQVCVAKGSWEVKNVLNYQTKIPFNLALFVPRSVVGGLSRKMKKLAQCQCPSCPSHDPCAGGLGRGTFLC